MFSTSTADTILTDFWTGISTLMTSWLGYVFIAIAGLLVLGFTFRLIKRHVTGRKV